MGKLDGNFWYIKNLLNENEKELLYQYCKLRHYANFNRFDDVQTSLGETCFYGDHLMEILLLKYTKKFQQTIGKEILPTYSFWRMYNKFSTLEKHKDRPECELTASINLGGCGTPWPIFVEGKAVEIAHGDAVIYHGHELEHWRDEFQGDHQAQVFFHWVYADGDKKHLKYDGRDYVGLPMVTKHKTQI